MAAKAQRERMSTAVYIGPNGEGRSPVGATALELRYTNGVKVRLDYADLAKSKMEVACALFGARNKVSDGSAKEGGISLDEAIEVCEETFDSLRRGVWREPTERGPNIGLIIAAIFRAKGEKPSDAREKELSTKLAAAEYRLGAMANTAIKAAYAQIQAERAAARAKELAGENAKAGKVDLSSF